MNMLKVGLVLSVLVGGVVGGSVLAELFHVSGFMLRMIFIVGFTGFLAVQLACLIGIGKAFFN